MNVQLTIEELLAVPRMAETVAEVRRRVSAVYPLTAFEMFTREGHQELWLSIGLDADELNADFGVGEENVLGLYLDWLYDSKLLDLPLTIVTGVRGRTHEVR